MKKIKLIQQDGVTLFACQDVTEEWFINKCKTELPDLDSSQAIGLFNGQRQLVEEEYVTCKTIKVETM